MNGGTIALLTLLFIVLSAFFVIIEFSLMGARRHRLEVEAETKASARAALRGMNELTLMLAGAQLGITGCTFALGAVTKPAFEYWLGPWLIVVGLPDWLATGVAFAASLLLVTMLHLVVGEMAPKSWALAYPERSAKLIGLASRGYIWLLRPFLEWVNSIANAVVRSVGVTPVERAAVGGHNADTIRQLVEHSAKAGVLEPKIQSQISEAIRLGGITAGDIVRKNTITGAIAETGSVLDAQAAAQETGHLRVLLADEDGVYKRVVHVRDTLPLDSDTPAVTVARPLMQVTPETPVYEMLNKMREAGVQIVVVSDGTSGQNIITVKDVIRRLLT